LEDHSTRYSNVIISGDFNINILAVNAHGRDFLDVSSGLGLIVVYSVHPTHVGQRPTVYNKLQLIHKVAVVGF
jgi:hypothetical protein